MLDEIDKLGADFRGDPSSALLEVLDPEQNTRSPTTTSTCRSTCREVMFIATANMLDRSPARCATAWRSSSSPATPRGEARDRASRTWSRSSSRSTGSAGRDRAHRRRRSQDHREYTREAGVRNLERRSAAVRARSRAWRGGAEAGDARRDDASTQVPSASGPPRILHEETAERGPARRRHRARLDAAGRRHPVRRGDAHAGQGQADPHRPARRRDEGVGAGRALVRRARARSSASIPDDFLEPRHPHPRPGRRDPEGRPVGRASRWPPRWCRC